MDEKYIEESEIAVKEKKKNKFRTLDVVEVAMMAAIITVCSWISIPTAAVSFTLQTFAVFVSVGLLGTKKSTVSVLVYILLGAVGVPVFSGFRGGISALLGTTGGYIVGFLFLSLISGFIIDKTEKKIYGMILGMVAGLIACYAFGTAWYMFVYLRETGAVGIGTVLGWCVLPFILPDCVKMALAIVISKAVSSRIKI